MAHALPAYRAPRPTTRSVARPASRTAGGAARRWIRRHLVAMDPQPEQQSSLDLLDSHH